MDKPTIFISKCLGFDYCRYNGLTINDSFVELLSKHVNVVTTCPEMDIGLGVPRMPIRISADGDDFVLHQPSSGKDLTQKMNKFGDKYLKALPEIDGFLLKYKSPSCGISAVKLYAKVGSNMPKGATMGFFAKNVKDKFPSHPLEDEARLKNFKIREGYLTKVFLHFRFRQVISKGKISALIDFQTQNKYLFMAVSQSKLRKMGNILAQYDKRNYDEIQAKYSEEFYSLLAMNMRKSNMINALQHIAGYFKKNNSKQEKDFFSESLEMYKEGRIPLSSIIYILRTWALRDKQEYILQQTILEPFPKELVELKSSGKTIDI